MRWMGLLVFAACLAVSCDGSGDAGPTPEATNTGLPGSPGAGASATPDTSDVIELRFTDPAELPEGVALIIETGCWQCDGPSTGFVRLRRLPDGALEERTLFDPADYGGSISGSDFDGASGTTTISVCERGCGDLVGAATAIYQSRDGGVSYAAGPRFDEWLRVAGSSGGEAILTGPAAEPDLPVPTRTLGGNVIVPPDDGVNPYPLPSEILWDSNGRSTLRAPDGTVLSTSASDQIGDVTSIDEGGEILAMAIYRQGPPPGYRLSIRRRTPQGLQHERTYEGFIRVGPALDACRVLANTDLPAGRLPTPDTGGAAFTNFWPVILNLCESAAQPIVDPFEREPYLNGRNFVVAMLKGPFVSVADDVGDCLNVRAEPSATADSEGCFVGGVLLRDLGESQPGGTQTWRHVVTPDGDEGWVSEEFLAP